MPPKKPKPVAHRKAEAASQILPYLFLGPRSSVTSSVMTSHDITQVLSIGATPECAGLPGIIYHRLPLSDNLNTTIRAATNAANKIISDVAENGGKIFVHCSAAVSRSPTIVCAYLVQNCTMTLKQALGHVIRERPAICPNPGFVVQLKEMELEMTGAALPSLDVDELPLAKSARMELFGL